MAIFNSFLLVYQRVSHISSLIRVMPSSQQPIQQAIQQPYVKRSSKKRTSPSAVNILGESFIPISRSIGWMDTN